ncbi:hypothetical protein ACTQ6A_13845 [Lachnospiraceae bacterium LCP25S3_G4]
MNKIIDMIIDFFLDKLKKVCVSCEELQPLFFNPVYNKEHWSEENYLNNPIKYKVKCKICVYNEKDYVSGINNCSIKIETSEKIICLEEENVKELCKDLQNIGPKNRKEVTIEQEGVICWGDKLKNGYEINLFYTINGKKKQKKLCLKKV